MQGYIEKYLLDPIIYGTGYNIVNTVFYALLLGLLVYYTIKLFEKIELKLDSHFFSYYLFYIFIGSGLRVLRDYEVITSNFFKTPGIYIIIYVILVVSILIGIYLNRIINFKYHYFPLFVGILISLFTSFKLIELGLNFLPFFKSLIISGLIVAIVFIVLRKLEFDFINEKFNLGIIKSHMLDASATYLGISFYGLTAQHVLPNAIISATHPSVMFPLKLGVILPVLYYLDKSEKGMMRDVLKVIILTLGLAPGLRDILLIMAG
tara:strand:+ start:21192 stop:21983 length:792 start_codon:yes stop_codon:yes gene_type:complete